MGNRILRTVTRQIARLGGKINEHTSHPDLSPTLAALENSVWPKHPFAHHRMDDERFPTFFSFEFTELGAGYVKSEPGSGGWLSIGYDEEAQYFRAVPMVCRLLCDPPVYRIDHETQEEMGVAQSLSDFLRMLEIRALVAQESFFADGLRFRDERLANLIRCKLHKTDGKISSADLSAVRELNLAFMAVELTALSRDLEDERAVEMDDIPDCGIALDDLRHFTKLAILDLSNNKDLSDIRPLSGLAKLHRLSLEGTAVRDLSPLRGLPLRSLHISRCPVKDFSLLLELSELRELTAFGSAIETDVTESLRNRGVAIRT